MAPKLDNPYPEFKGNRVWSNDRPTPAHLQRLFPIYAEIEAENSKATYSLNDLIVYFANGHHKDLVPFDDLKSFCSGKPAVIYRCHEAELALTPDEAFRLAMRALTQDEFTAICNEVGAIWDLHDDFYDPDTGEAIQPKVDVPETAASKT